MEHSERRRCDTLSFVSGKILLLLLSEFQKKLRNKILINEVCVCDSDAVCTAITRSTHCSAVDNATGDRTHYTTFAIGCAARRVARAGRERRVFDRQVPAPTCFLTNDVS